MNSLAVVVLNYNGIKLLEKFLPKVEVFLNKFTKEFQLIANAYNKIFQLN